MRWIILRIILQIILREMTAADISWNICSTERITTAPIWRIQSVSFFDPARHQSDPDLIRYGETGGSPKPGGSDHWNYRDRSPCGGHELFYYDCLGHGRGAGGCALSHGWGKCAPLEVSG